MLLGEASAWGSGGFASATALSASATWSEEVSVQWAPESESKLQEGVSVVSPEGDLLEESDTTWRRLGKTENPPLKKSQGAAVEVGRKK